MGFLKIFPPIGIARVGNSEEFYLAPETLGKDGKGSLPIPVQFQDNSQPELPITKTGEDFKEDDFRDGDNGEGKMRRQAVRFRIFYYDSPTDNKPKEVVVTNGCIDENTQKKATKIVWKVRIANKKASWYEFRTKNGADGYTPNHPLRNSNVTDDRFNKLVIAPSVGTLEATESQLKGKHDFKKQMDEDGWPTELPENIDYLGTMCLDEHGHLVFVGGYGKSGSKNDPPEINSYANNDGWWDDTSDGPVMAYVELEDDTDVNPEAVPAWVIVAPPAYAPEIPNIVTLYDVMFDVAVRHLKHNNQPEGGKGDEDSYIIDKNGLWNPNYKPDWETQIKPILDRASLTSWVVAMPPKPHTFDYEKLRDNNPKYNSLRQYFFSNIRPPEEKNALKSKTTGYPMMPYMPGDDATDSSQKSSKYFTLTDTQYFFLKQWANGKFETVDTPSNDQVTPLGLTMASLEACVGGPFSPGIEMTWICRNPKLYQEPFRIKSKLKFDDDDGIDNATLSLGTDWEKGFEPGDVTKYMALPWQADFDVCSTQLVEQIVWWWPAQRPLFVYLDPRPPLQPLMADAPQVPDETIKDKQVPWVGTSYDQNADDYLILGYLEMVQQWHQLGFIFDISETLPEYFKWEGSYFAEVKRYE
ncbi:LodA/GoxA family CTQ-dependent oxidase [Okeania sp. SIO2B9]|uniref:LodA/GoxA family CTQ-dependent oxidase n=1 Tax=Okeania sp. SIO2B9 TaxID=2607782 RepID=UPI001428E475|nr:LodA/GoxA family CTQ-dependent oxidase [Okeania sp. SIO2B9]NES90186.1 hypothetical protein [Okeania sp. SIO2B9]